MIRVAVINIKNLVRNLIKCIIIILLFLGIRNIINFFFQSVSDFDYKRIINKNTFFQLEEVEENKFDDILDIAFFTSTKVEAVSDTTYLESTNNVKNNTKNVTENITNTLIQENNLNIKNETNVEVNTEINTEEYKTEYTQVSTSVVSENNISENYNTVYDTVKIKNESKYTLTENMLTPNINFSNKKDIVIFHTHTCESYTPTDQYSYVASGNFRTIDMNYSVARVGAELTNYLISKNFNVTHLTDLHDYPAYNGSYTRSYNTVNKTLNNSSAQLVIDLHRDAVGSKSNYAPSVMIGDEKVAQLMFVIGTNGGGLSHDNWNTNLKLAIKIQQKANEMYPGLFRPIVVRNSRYNQNLADGACIIEVGATGNTLEESIGSMKYLSNVLEEVMKD